MSRLCVCVCLWIGGKAALRYYIATGVALRVSMPTVPMYNISLCGPLSAGARNAGCR